MHLIALLFAALGALAADAGPPPTFAEFRVQPGPVRPPASPILRTEIQRMFRTRIRQAVRKGPNFAGHYTIASWGCGSSCVSFALADRTTGRVYDGPFRILGYAIPYQYEGGWQELEYRLDSSLIIVRGCPEDADCATYYFEWAPPKWKLLRRAPHGPLIE